jgi:small subunit ribosomal protein S20
LPTHDSTAKRLRQNKKLRLQNRAQRSEIRTLIRKIRQEPGAEKAPELLKEVSILLDRYATRGLHHKNKANRLKSNLSRLVKSAQNPA